MNNTQNKMLVTRTYEYTIWQNPPQTCLFKVGDKVVCTNEDGQASRHLVRGFADQVFPGNRFIYVGNVPFPANPGQLRLDLVPEFMDDIPYYHITFNQNEFWFVYAAELPNERRPTIQDAKNLWTWCKEQKLLCENTFYQEKKLKSFCIDATEAVQKGFDHDKAEKTPVSPWTIHVEGQENYLQWNCLINGFKVKFRFHNILPVNETGGIHFSYAYDPFPSHTKYIENWGLRKGKGIPETCKHILYGSGVRDKAGHAIIYGEQNHDLIDFLNYMETK